MIETLNAATLGYVLGGLRPADETELLAMMGDLSPATIAEACLQGPAWSCRVHGETVAAFGYKHRTRYVVEAWCLGTVKITRGMPEITTFIREEFPKQFDAAGVQVCEVRSIMSHKAAHEWMTGRLGFTYRVILADQGGNGESVALLTWRRPWKVP